MHLIYLDLKILEYSVFISFIEGFLFLIGGF